MDTDPPEAIERMKTAFVETSFVRTADQNYVLARYAMLNALTLDGYWLAAQAVEKYLKASLLLNNNPVESYGHKLSALFDKHRQVVADLVPKEFLAPPFHDDFARDAWGNAGVSAFVADIEFYGKPDNRYLIDGYYSSYLNLLKLDQLIFFIRRTCAPISAVSAIASGNWRLSSQLPIETWIDSNSHPLRSQLMMSNAIWQSVVSGAGVVIELNRSQEWQASAFAAAYSEGMFEFRTESDPQERNRPLFAEFLRWAVENVHFSKKIKREIQDKFLGGNPK